MLWTQTTAWSCFPGHLAGGGLSRPSISSTAARRPLAGPRCGDAPASTPHGSRAPPLTATLPSPAGTPRSARSPSPGRSPPPSAFRLRYLSLCGAKTLPLSRNPRCPDTPTPAPPCCCPTAAAGRTPAPGSRQVQVQVRVPWGRPVLRLPARLCSPPAPDPQGRLGTQIHRDPCSGALELLSGERASSSGNKQ